MENRTLKTFPAAILPLIIFVPLLRAQVYSEAPIKLSDSNEVLTDMFYVKFKFPDVIEIPAGKIKGNEISGKYSKIKELFWRYCNSWNLSPNDMQFSKAIPQAREDDTLYFDATTCEIKKLPILSHVYVVEFTKPVEIEKIISQLKVFPEVEYAHGPVQWVDCAEIPNDPKFTDGGQWYLNTIQASDAWGITKGNSNIKIALIESGGTELTHSDLQAKVVGGDGSPGGVQTPHGTNVAGIAGAVTNNGIGIASLGWNISLLTYKPRNDDEYRTVLAQKIHDAVDEGANIINCSFRTIKGGFTDCNLNNKQTGSARYYYYNWDYDLVGEAISYALVHNVVVIASAGNNAPSIGEYDPCEPVPYPIYPGSYSGVIAVSGSQQDNNFVEGWNYGSHVGVNAPARTNANTGLWSTDLNNSYTNDGSKTSGTSFSAPLVSALAALIKSVNPSFTPSQIETILKNTADKVGQYPYTNGRNNYFGFGRINALGALLETLNILAGENKSINYWASGYNNNHTIERGYFGKLHEVFHSGGEIFYRRSSNNGLNWEITTRLSTGNGANEAPSIVAGVGSTDILCITWQRKLSNYQYEIYTRFSSDMGTTWLATSSPMNVIVSWYQSNENYGPGPTPVVSSYYRNGYEGIPSYLLVYAANDGLYFRTSNSFSSGWTASSIIPGSSGSNSKIWFPSLASYNNQGYRVNLIYDDRYYHVYSQVFNDNGTWSNRVIADWMGSYNRTSSIAIDNNNTMLGIWSGWNSTFSKYSIRFREGDAVNNTWSTYWKEWCISSNSSYFPSLSYYNKGGAYPNGRVVIYHTDNNNIYRQKYSGSYSGDWTQESITSNALFSNITHERSNTLTPKEIWTNQTYPYTIQFSSVSLPKGNALESISFRRAAVIADKSNNANLRIELSQPYIEYDDGEKIFIPFKVYDYGAQYNLTIADLFDHLQTEKINVPSNAVRVKFTLFISSSQPDTLSTGALNTNNNTNFKGINFEILVKDGSNQTQLSNFVLQTLTNNKGLHNFSKTFELNANAFRNKNIFFIPKVDINGPFRNEDLVFSLGNITISKEDQLFKDSILTIQSTKIPKDYSLGQNFPNPFNPHTVINFSLPKQSNVSLKIYNVLGKPVYTVFDSEPKSPGNYEVSFNADNLPSGVYFYTLISGNFIQTRKMILAK